MIDQEIFDQGDIRNTPPVPPPRPRRKKKFEDMKNRPFTFRYEDYGCTEGDDIVYSDSCLYPNRRRSYLDVEHPDIENDPLPRTLYDQLHVPDNFTVKNYLAEMKVNPFPDTSTYVEVLLVSSRFVLQFSVTLCFYVTYYHMLRDDVSADTLFKWVVISTPVAYVYYRFTAEWQRERCFRSFTEHFPRSLFRDHLRVSMVYLLLAYQMTPILRTLSSTISRDTIDVISGLAWSCHLITVDYGIDFMENAQTLSVNAAVIGCICMTSTLPTDQHSVALILFAVQVFLVFPLFSHIWWDSPITILFSVMLGASVCFTVSQLLCIMYSVTVLFAIFIAPAVYVNVVPYKHNIYGPWDEACIADCLEPEKIYKSYAY